MEFIIDKCFNCPYFYHGTSECSLAPLLQNRILNGKQDYVEDRNKTPKWCPLRKESVTLNYQPTNH